MLKRLVLYVVAKGNVFKEKGKKQEKLLGVRWYVIYSLSYMLIYRQY